MTRTSSIATTLFLALFLASLARAEPQVRVRAESRIEIGVEYVGPRLQVRGALRDELGNPLPGVEVLVTLRADEGAVLDRRRVTTNARGRFVVERHAPQSQIVLQAAYAGDGWHQGVRVERRIDQTRADVRLELRLPEKGHLDLDAESLPIRVLAESDSGGQALPMTLRDETGRALASGRTDVHGRLSWDLRSDTLGSPGPGLLQLESSGDETRSEAQTEARVVRFRRTHLTLKRDREPAEAGRATRVFGWVRTAAGPRPGVPVGLFLDDEHATTAVTDAEGRYEAWLWPERATTYRAMARVEGDPTGAYTEAQRSLRLEVAPPGRLPWGFLLLMLLPCGVLAALRLGRAAPDGHSERPPRITLVPGVQTGPRTRLRPLETEISGRVVHARTGFPIREAEVRAEADGQPARTAAISPNGHFTLPSCEQPTRLTVQAPGFGTVTTIANCPHRGEWRGCEIRLDSLRDRAARPYRQLVVPRLPSALAYNLWTPREIALALRHDLGAEIEGISRDVERAAFAHDPPTAEDIATIRERVEALAPPTAGSDGADAGSRRPGSRG